MGRTHYTRICHFDSRGRTPRVHVAKFDSRGTHNMSKRAIEEPKQHQWYDAHITHPPVDHQNQGLSKYCICFGNKSTYYLARYMIYCDAWFKSATCIVKPEAWMALPAPPHYKRMDMYGKDTRTTADRKKPRPKYNKRTNVPDLNEMWDRLAANGVVTERPEDDEGPEKTDYYRNRESSWGT